MSEFKFACPVCGQHITADSSTSGGQLECPTCFQKIVVPQASGPDSKFIIAASQVSKPRPVGAQGDATDAPVSRKSALPIAAVLLVLLLGTAGTLAYVFRGKIFKTSGDQAQAPTNQYAKTKAPPAPRTVYPVPTNVAWTLDLAKADIPDAKAVGSINSQGFVCEKAILQAVLPHEGKGQPHCDLTLRQGRSGPADLGVTVQLFANAGEELSGKTVQINSDKAPPVPKVTLRWKDDQQKPVNRSIPSGYAMKLVFGDAANARMPGSIYISFPDDAKSFVAGTFEAEIRKPTPPKPKQPKATQQQQPKPSG
jgi:hypothetical protein